MKKIIILIISIFIVFPSYVLSESNINLDEYNHKGIIDVLNEEKIDNTLKEDGYKESEDQVIIYLFRGNGCSHCKELLSYFANDLFPNYDNKIKLISFETWNDINNKNLMSQVVSYMNEDIKSVGVPFYVIGDKSFVGYSASMNPTIESKIEELLNKDANDRYDVIKRMQGKQGTSEKQKNNRLIIVLILLIILISISIAFKIIDIKKQKSN